MAMLTPLAPRARRALPSLALLLAAALPGIPASATDKPVIQLLGIPSHPADDALARKLLAESAQLDPRLRSYLEGTRFHRIGSGSPPVDSFPDVVARIIVQQARAKVAFPVRFQTGFHDVKKGCGLAHPPDRILDPAPAASLPAILGPTRPQVVDAIRLQFSAKGSCLKN